MSLTVLDWFSYSPREQQYIFDECKQEYEVMFNNTNAELWNIMQHISDMIQEEHDNYTLQDNPISFRDHRARVRNLSAYRSQVFLEFEANKGILIKN